MTDFQYFREGEIVPFGWVHSHPDLEARFAADARCLDTGTHVHIWPLEPIDEGGGLIRVRRLRGDGSISTSGRTVIYSKPDAPQFSEEEIAQLKAWRIDHIPPRERMS